MMDKRGTPLSTRAFQGERGAVWPPESTDTGDNEVLPKADDGREGAECEKQIRGEKRNRGERRREDDGADGADGLARSMSA